MDYDKLPPSEFVELLARDLAGEDILAGRPRDPPRPRKKKRRPPSQLPPKRRPPVTGTIMVFDIFDDDAQETPND